MSGNDMVVDELTGLYDFKSFILATEKLLKANPDKEYEILVWDIIQFKVVNDLYGMEAGDRLLCEIATEIRRGVPNGTCGRIGSDKFVCCVLSSGMDYSNQKNIYEFKIDDEGNVHKVLLQGGCYHITDRTTPIIKMCDRAILALNSIKGKYTETISQYTKESRDEVIMGQRFAADFDAAIKDKQFKVYIQPIYDAKTSVVISGEVLVRWDHPELGFLPPGRFIEYFEKNFLITRLDKYVWEEACRIIRRMIDEGKEVIPLSINVSRTDFLYDELSEVLIDLVHKYDIDPKYLKIEITESAYMDSPVKLRETVGKLRAYGFRIMMDDFGTGFSSLNTLRELSFDILKIDKELIDEISNSDKAGNVVSSIIKMANWLGMEVVSEGVENEKQLSILRNMDCNYIQGYYFSKPVSESEFFSMEMDLSKKTNIESNQINLDELFSVHNPSGRLFLDKMVGALCICEIDNDDLVLKRTNDECCKLYGATPATVYDLFETVSIESKSRLLYRCEKAMTSKEAVTIELSASRVNGKKLWVLVKIYYIGTEDDKPQFLFNMFDITKEYNKRNKQLVRDNYSILKTLFVEILRLNYDDNTVTTIFSDVDKVPMRFNNEPLDVQFNRLATVLEESEYARVASEMSYTKICEFLDKNIRAKVIKMDIKAKDGSFKRVELLITRDEEMKDSKVVILCARMMD